MSKILSEVNLPLPAKIALTTFLGGEVRPTKNKSKLVDNEVDNFPMKCQECGLQKKTIKGQAHHMLSQFLNLRIYKFVFAKGDTN